MLLVLDIRVPASEFDDLLRVIAGEWPAYLGYATSFVTIGGIWLAHPGLFRHLRFASDRVMRINLLLLMAVAFLPFPTRLVSQAIRDERASRVATVFYGISLLTISLLFLALWWVVAHDRQLLSRELSDDDVDAMLRAAAPSVGLYSGATVLELLTPRLAALAYLAISVAGILRARGDLASSPAGDPLAISPVPAETVLPKVQSETKR